MNSGARSFVTLVLPWLLMLTACTEPVVVVDEPAEVETCEWLIPVGIELVNDYFYTLLETDLGVTGGDPDLLPTSIIALNARGAELDRRAAELECDLDELNTAIVAATAGLESTDPVVNVLLETVRNGVVADVDAPVGSWNFVDGTVNGEQIEPAPGQTITLAIDEDGIGTGSTGCNSYDIIGAASGGDWPVEGYVVTDVACPSATYTAAEDAYIEAVQLVSEYVVADDSLVLRGGPVVLSFVRLPSTRD